MTFRWSSHHTTTILRCQLDWFKLNEGQYIPLTPDENGVIRSEIFPGLQLDIMALLDGDLAQVLAKLQQGLATAEHGVFVEMLSVGSR